MRTRPIEHSFFHWMAVIVLTLGCLAAKDHLDWLIEYPDALIISSADWLNVIMDWVVKHFGAFCISVSWVLGQ